MGEQLEINEHLHKASVICANSISGNSVYFVLFVYCLMPGKSIICKLV